MILAFVGLPIHRLRPVKAAQLRLGHIRHGDETVELLQERCLVQRGKSGERGGADGFGCEARRLKGTFVVRGMLIGEGEHRPELLLLHPAELRDGLFFISL